MYLNSLDFSMPLIFTAKFCLEAKIKGRRKNDISSIRLRRERRRLIKGTFSDTGSLDLRILTCPWLTIFLIFFWVLSFHSTRDKRWIRGVLKHSPQFESAVVGTCHYLVAVVRRPSDTKEELLLVGTLSDNISADKIFGTNWKFRLLFPFYVFNINLILI